MGKQWLWIAVGLFTAMETTYAQQHGSFNEYRKKKQQEFAQYKQQRQKEFEDYRAKRNKEFADYLAQRWIKMQHFKGLELPPCPDPVKPVIKPEGSPKPVPNKIPVKRVTPLPKPQPRIPLTINPEPPTPVATFSADFYGTRISVRLETGRHKFTLSNVDEQSVSKVWTWLSDGRMDLVVADCLSWREAMHLSDYAYVQMLGNICNSFFGGNYSNEAVVMRMFLLAQSGYDVKCARQDNDLILLLSIREKVYEMTYLEIDGKKYYTVDNPGGEGGYYSFQQSFAPESQSCSMLISEKMEFPGSHWTAARRFVSKCYPQLDVQIRINRNLMDLYTHYPHVGWDIYANAPMSDGLSEALIPVLKQEISGKSEEEAANMLINFVQTAFEYMTDGDQFGYERPFFMDELFYYPYSDCEDRAILYSNLVRRLLHLDVVLLHYPNHLATAVRFNVDVPGDYVMVDGRKYVVCDPTYIGANIGEAMPKFKRTEVEVVKL